MHYSFDYARQIHIPSNPMQPGPIYFKTPRKCDIFGVTSEAVPRQVNFLIDESVSIGKGANSIINYLHYFLEHHGFQGRRSLCPSSAGDSTGARGCPSSHLEQIKVCSDSWSRLYED